MTWAAVVFCGHRFRPALGGTLLICCVTLATPGGAAGLYRNGVGARAMALGGADAAYPVDALSAMAANPAGLATLEQKNVNLGFAAAGAGGNFSNAANNDGSLNRAPGFLPEGAFGMRLGRSDFAIGVSVIPEAAGTVDWTYMDAPGGLGGTSYGLQPHRAETALVRGALGAAWMWQKRLAFGASLGLQYNQNKLHAPYIFQSQPALAGAKTLLDLQTAGWGWNAQFGALWRARDDLQLALTYTTSSVIDTKGRATGNAQAQFTTLGGAFASAPPDFHYDASVENTFPQSITAGMSWRMHPQWRLALQLDWINWAAAFRQLPVKLSNGSNAALNGLTGTADIVDTAPLGWRDQWVAHAGIECAVTERLALRLGYTHSNSPVPDRTLTPLTAVINEHTFTAGFGWERGSWQIDCAYQYDLPQARTVGVSSLRAGEYSRSRTEVDIHWLAVTTGFRF